MNAKRTIKKILALGAGVTMVGATIMGAMAYNLASYPAPFVQDGTFSGKIVIGADAKAEDTLGAIDISASLQRASVKKTSVNIPGQAGQVSLEGDAYRIGTGSDLLELRESLANVTDTLTEGELAALKGGTLSTSEGTTSYNQYLRFESTSTLQTFGVNYRDNDDNKVSDYLVIPSTNDPIFEWELQFGQGLESRRTDSTGATRLTDMEDRTINIFGTDFNIVRALVADGGDSTPESFTMTLMAGSVPATLREGETKTFTLSGVEHEVTLIFVSDPQTGTEGVQAKFMVDGEVTKALGVGDTETLSGGLQLGVRDILANPREGVASFYLGADKIVFSDTTPTSAGADGAGQVEINNENINDAELDVIGACTVTDCTKFEVNNIKYRLKVDAASGSDVYISPGHGIRELLRRPEAMLSPTFDIKYEGLVKTQDTAIELNGRSDDSYDLVFTNTQGQKFTVPYISNRDTTFKFGDDNDDLVFVEGVSATDYVIDDNDYFIVSNGPFDDKSVSWVLRYDDVDTTDKVVEFTDIASGKQIEVSFTEALGVGTGDLVVGGHTFDVYVQNANVSAATHGLAIYLNADNDVASDKVEITVRGGGIVDIADAFYTSSAGTQAVFPLNQSALNLTSVVGNGTTIDGVATWYNASDLDQSETITAITVGMSLTTLQKNFDTQGGNEVIGWRVSESTNPDVSLSHAAADMVGPLEGSGIFRQYVFTNDDSDDDHTLGMSDYGVLVDYYTPTGSSRPAELTLSYPNVQRTAQVFVTAGTVKASEGGAGVTTDVVNPIAVGLAVLDRDAPAVGSENMIVVGGPCVNDVAAELMGKPSNCAAGFTAGKARIVSYDTSGKVAILVAGYSAQDTLGASYVLSNYDDYQLTGSEVEVVVADLNDITVQAVGPKNTTP